MIVIRADGNAKIGAGHLMRCLTVAEAVIRMQGSRKNICFFCADGQSADLAREHGFQAPVLGTDYRKMETELSAWEYIMQTAGSGEHTILVDSYYVTDAYLKQLSRYGRVCLLDDMQEHTYPVDMLINYNAFADEALYQKLYRGMNTKILVGSDYVPVREQFLNVDYSTAEVVKHVLITTGGGDIDNIAGAILQAIYCEGIEFHVVTGRYNPHLKELKEWECEKSGVHIYHDVRDMAQLMKKCDIAVTAGGTTIYELAAIGVPFLCFSYAQNQEALTEYIGEHKIAGFAGAYHKDAETVLKKMQELFTTYCKSYDCRRACFEAEKKMIDGRGAERIARELLNQV